MGHRTKLVLDDKPSQIREKSVIWYKCTRVVVVPVAWPIFGKRLVKYNFPLSLNALSKERHLYLTELSFIHNTEAVWFF